MAKKTPLKYASLHPKKNSPSQSYVVKHKPSRRRGGESIQNFFLIGRRYFFFFILGLVVLMTTGWLYLRTTLPDIEDVEDIILPEATVIMDRNGEVLYKIFQQNRSYVEYEDISPHMIDAIIAIEDQSFWTNDVIDYGGIVRVIAGQLGLIDYSGGCSTITQQLLKNILLADESSVYVRKFKEWMLAGKLNDMIKQQVESTHSNLTDDELQRKMKEEVLELYLNYIFFGQNSYGVQAASQTFFATDAKELTPLESAIIASLPQSPTRYNPYVNPVPVMGKLSFYQGDQEVTPSDTVFAQAHERVKELLPRLQMSNQDVGAIEKQLSGLMNFTLTVDSTTYRVSYDLGRKDYVLLNMFGEGMLEEVVFKNAFLEGFDYQFTEGYVTDIKAPHFVWWVQDLLLDMFPDNGEQLMQRGGLQVTTTLDYQMQEWAETAIEENYKSLLEYDANNAGMIYIDSTNGDVLTYVGSVDYFDDDVDGEVDMVRALRQPGSSIKPFIYALGIERLGLTMDTPLFDVPLTVGGNTPQNADGDFLGLMPMREALAYSRNIAPIKIFLALGGEDVVKPFLRNIGLRSLSTAIGYGYPLAIGAGEVKMIEMANAYAHLSTSGRPAAIDPIMKVTTADGSILYQKETKQQTQYIPDGVANLVSVMLADKGNMPPERVANYTLNGGLSYAIKSGTSDVKVNENGRQVVRPRDGRLAAYTPSKVAVFWSGNTDGSPMGPKAFGGRLNAPVWKTFWGQLLKNNLLMNENFSRNGTASLEVDKYTGLLPGAARPEDATVSTRGYGVNLPTTSAVGWESIQYDTACDGKLSPLTPSYEVGDGWIVDPTTFMPDKRDLSAITTWYSEQTGFFLQLPDTVCDGRDGEQNDALEIAIIKPVNGASVTQSFDVWYDIKHDTQLKTLRVYINDVKVGEKLLRQQTNVTDIMRVEGYQGLGSGEQLLTVEAADVNGSINRKQVSIVIVDSDLTPPYLLDTKITIDGEEDAYTIYLPFSDDASGIDDVTVSIDGDVVDTILLEGSIARFGLEALTTISYMVTDTQGNTAEGVVDLAQY